MFIKTFNGCYFSQIQVYPKNWKKSGASCENSWYFWYRFYDPTITDSKGKVKPKLVIVKKMNRFKTLAERREATELRLNAEFRDLTEKGFNPITLQWMADLVDDFNGDITPDTPFIEALNLALEKLIVTDMTRKGIKGIIKGTKKAAIQLRLNDLPISAIGRRHLKKILERCEALSQGWSAHRYNAYRGYLLMLFKELVEQEAINGNPVRDISKRTVIQRIKPVPDFEQRNKIDQHLAKTFPRLRMFVHLFFHSGGRKTELLQLKPSMVDLQKQKYKCLIKKRKKWTEVERTIKDIAIPFWSFFLENCPDDKYIFGPRFLPASKPMGQEMPSRYWKEHIKDKKTVLGIDIDFYSLKHLNTTEIVDYLDEQAAATLNAHTSTAMVVGIYDVKQKDRQHERLKKVNNGFA